MTRAHSAVPLADAPDLDAATALVRARGLRLSTARRLVLEALYDADGPLTAEQLAGEMDVASVYRNLETLEELGLVRHMHLGHGPGLYGPAAETDEYVTCERCGRSEAVAPDVLRDVRQAVRDAVGYEPRFGHFPLTGLCPSCQEKLSLIRKDLQ